MSTAASPPAAAGAPWPPSSGLSTQVVPLKDVVLPTAASCIISAPARVVWDVLRATARYAEWNSFCPRVTITSQPAGTGADTSTTLQWDTRFVFHVIMDAARPNSVHDTVLRVTDVSTPAAPSSYITPAELAANPSYTADVARVFRIAWSIDGGLVTRGLRTERFHEIIVLDDERCEVRTWECQGGILARTVKWLYKATLQQKFEDWCADLKVQSEREWEKERAADGEQRDA